MANIKSQKKRALTNLKRNARQSAAKTELKTSIKAVKLAVEAKDKDAAVKALDKANSLLDKAITSHNKHANYVARQKSRLAKQIASI